MPWGEFCLAQRFATFFAMLSTHEEVQQKCARLTVDTLAVPPLRAQIGHHHQKARSVHQIEVRAALVRLWCFFAFDVADLTVI